MDQKTVSERRSTTRRADSPDIQVYRNVEQLGEIAAAWDDLVFNVVGRLPSTSYAWVASYLERRREPEQQWVCLAAFQGGELTGVLPVGLGSVRVLGKTVPMLEQPGDAHTQSVDAVVRPGYEATVMGAFREALEEAAPGWFGLDYDRTEKGTPFLAAEGWKGATVCHEEVSGASVVSCMGDWDEYAEGLSRNFRKRLRRENRRLAELGEVTAEFYAGADADPEMLERFVRIEASGWKGEAGSAIASQESLMAFYRALCRRLYDRGVLEWHFLRAGGRELAGHLVVRSGRGIAFCKIGYDESFAWYSPGVMLLERALERAFRDAETAEANFLTDRSWHDSWQPEKRSHYRIRIYPHRVRSLLAGAWPQMMRQRLRRSSGLRAAVRAVRDVGRRLGGERAGGEDQSTE